MTNRQPQFIGVDSNEDFVWRLPSGRWTWGEDPIQAALRERSFTPDRYLEKYGPVNELEVIESPKPGSPGQLKVGDRMISVRVAPERKPVDPSPVMPDRGGSLGAPGRRGAQRALRTFLGVLNGWIEGAHDNHEALGHRGESTDRLCWTEFHPSDIRRMVNDAARELGLSEFPEPKSPREDTYR